MFENYTTKYIHTSPEAYELFDEICNSMGNFSSKSRFYVKESLCNIDKFLQIRENTLDKQKIDQYDLHEFEKLGKKHYKLTEKLDISHLNNSFIYKYISEASETVEYTNKTILDENSKIAEFVRKKMKITKENAWNIVRKAQEMGIDPIKIQQKWAILGPSLMNIVAEYRPKEK